MSEESNIKKRAAVSEETRRKISESKKGKKRPNISGSNHFLFGKHHSEETKEKNREAHLGKRPSEETRKKMSGKIPWNKGKKATEEAIKNQSESHKGKIPGNWKGGISPENNKIRGSIEMRLWREAVFARDNWTDQKTGIKGGNLHAHHIFNFAQYPELRFAIDNGITLSVESHRVFHRKYGIKNNTREQLEEYLGHPL